MRWGSTEPSFVASRTAASRLCTRVSMLPVATAMGTMTRQPFRLVQDSTCGRSATSISAREGWEATACAANGLPASRLIVPHARTDFLSQLFNIFGLLHRGDREDEPVFLLQRLFQFVNQIGQTGRVLDVLFAFRLENLVALRLAIGQAHVRPLRGRRRWTIRRFLSQREAEQGGQRQGAT